jgi:hypothetical protein
MDDAGRHRDTVVALLAIITLILSGWALKATYVVTMPLTVAFLVTLVLRPLLGVVSTAAASKRRKGARKIGNAPVTTFAVGVPVPKKAMPNSRKLKARRLFIIVDFAAFVLLVNG